MGVLKNIFNDALYTIVQFIMNKILNHLWIKYASRKDIHVIGFA